MVSVRRQRPVPPFSYRILPRSPGVQQHVAKCDFPTHAVYEAFVDSGTVMEGREGTFGGGMVPRRARAIPSYLSPEPFNPEHASVPAHQKPRHPVRTVESGSILQHCSLGHSWTMSIAVCSYPRRQATVQMHEHCTSRYSGGVNLLLPTGNWSCT